MEGPVLSILDDLRDEDGVDISGGPLLVINKDILWAEKKNKH